MSFTDFLLHRQDTSGVLHEFFVDTVDTDALMRWFALMLPTFPGDKLLLLEIVQMDSFKPRKPELPLVPLLHGDGWLRTAAVGSLQSSFPL